MSEKFTFRVKRIEILIVQGFSRSEINALARGFEAQKLRERQKYSTEESQNIGRKTSVLPNLKFE